MKVTAAGLSSAARETLQHSTNASTGRMLKPRDTDQVAIVFSPVAMAPEGTEYTLGATSGSRPVGVEFYFGCSRMTRVAPGIGSLMPSRAKVSHSAIITADRVPVGPVAASLIQNHSTYSIALVP